MHSRTVSRHRQARRSPRAPPGGGVPMSACTATTFEQGCDQEWHGHPEIRLPPHWIPNIIGLESVNLTMPVCHWIRALSIAASDWCMQSLYLERSTNNAIKINGFCQCLMAR